MIVLSPEEMRLMDENCIRQYGIPALILMENAASAALNHILDSYRFNKVLIICGRGNNGGDGLALARKLYSTEKKVEVLISGSKGKMTDSSLQNLLCLEKLPIPIFYNPDKKRREKLFNNSELIVDALLGTGLNREVDGDKKELILEMNQSRSPVVSLDIPSGLDGKSSEELGCAVKAESTICFGAPKYGNIKSPGYLKNGKLICSRISFPPELYKDEKFKSELNLPEALKTRDPLGYKNSFGKILVIGGGGDYIGAPALAARAAYRSGAGYVTVAVPASHNGTFSIHCPEAVIKGLKETAAATISEENFELLLELSSKQDAVVLGPGMTQQEETVSLIRKLIPAIPVPLVIDADALNALAGFPELTLKRKSATVITPHPGEQRRLAEKTEDALEKAYNAICVYKGPRTVISLPEGREYINLTGNEALGTAGSGDVLAGIICALLAQEEDKSEAVKKAVLLHGLAADLFDGASDSFTASDIIELLPRCFTAYRENHVNWTRNCYNRMEIIP
ncbi:MULTISPECIES: NAD(P)H-hydrate dehydratase [unclassified Oceanispirochaeta]|uniref:NAD(P)H-hydrate dehydratase n=1 Tax=unclassified Oceanispirochaeta TaxID=2635722 RepID=UPI000E0904B6|nr:MULTISPECIES: NAD(P)H-hydrate dehydratase [unclassified Oceanispirochaeta]MBF9015282.1 NAD(P)H-hydrate dehydratase [Oceanispirochaeta sp. M2]NPD71740.1 NAD(P)H-hydrate dehydratase [Oceanispirochaeta sp. M1]RDG32932.1 NAD(P)H-hydrate dehydratase [Oceanispirochaeta sp. M1]